MALFAASVDLDGARLYRQLHGLPVIGEEEVVYSRAVWRLSDWAKQRGVALTWFAIGADLADDQNAKILARLAHGGDELGCHSQSHFYDLTRRSASEMRSEVEDGLRAVQRATGVVPSGFRAPGYVVNDVLLALLQELGFDYDSSVFPCPAYYALKAAAVAKLRLQGRPSRAILDTPAVLRAPRAPYRVGRPYWSHGAGILELPIQVTRRARLPFIGTALTMGGTAGARVLARGVLGEPFVNLELHAVDALDSSDGLADLAPHQPDLRIPWQKKLEAIDAAVSFLLQRGYASVRMDELAARSRAAL